MFLAESDENYAKAKSLHEGLVNQLKTIKAIAFGRSMASSASAKEQDAYRSRDYQYHLEKIERASVDYLTLQAKRYTAATVIDCWRSLNAARSRGQIS